MGAIQVSDHLQEQVRRERGVVEKRLLELRTQSARLHHLTETVDRELEETTRVLRSMDEMLGLAPQLSLEDVDQGLRGRRLREIAVQLLRQRRDPGIEIHYREWFALVADAGVVIGGKDPVATFLTQVARAPEVESVRPRSGLYRLKAA